MLDLDSRQYSMKILKQNIYAINLIEILKKQKIDEDFAVNYILNPDYQFLEEESFITIDYVLKLQPHLQREIMDKSYKKNDPDSPTFDISN
jgi:hypothetical protein